MESDYINLKNKNIKMVTFKGQQTKALIKDSYYNLVKYFLNFKCN